MKQIQQKTRGLFGSAKPIAEVRPSYEEAIELFKANPDQYFTVNGGKALDWDDLLRPKGLGQQSSDYITVQVRGRSIGYVARTLSVDRGVSFEIGHFAVDLECVGAGVATLMAQVLKTKLRARYSTKTIIFNEDHSAFFERNYVQFFTKLGAENPDPQHPRRWVWDISGSPTPG